MTHIRICVRIHICWHIFYIYIYIYIYVCKYIYQSFYVNKLHCLEYILFEYSSISLYDLLLSYILNDQHFSCMSMSWIWEVDWYLKKILCIYHVFLIGSFLTCYQTMVLWDITGTRQNNVAYNTESSSHHNWKEQLKVICINFVKYLYIMIYGVKINVENNKLR